MKWLMILCLNQALNQIKIDLFMVVLHHFIGKHLQEHHTGALFMKSYWPYLYTIQEPLNSQTGNTLQLTIGVVLCHYMTGQWYHALVDGIDNPVSLRVVFLFQFGCR